VSERSTNLRADAVLRRDLEINAMTLKLEGDVDILKMYLHTESEAASLRDSKTWSFNSENTKICLKVKTSKALNYLRHYGNRYSDQSAAISDQ